MTPEYSVSVCKTLQKSFDACALHRPIRVEQYDVGDELEYEVNSVVNNEHRARVHLVIEKFVGGGFAGQVYKVRLKTIDGDPVDGLDTDRAYAMKILIPPSRGSLWFRNILYGVGFQGPFQLQCNPAAARSGALWQKFIRRGAKIRFGDESAVNNIHATFVDSTLGSCGEFSDWVDGRTWRLEVDEYLDYLKKWKKEKEVDPQHLGSPEFRAKKQFMADFVKLLHDMGAHEFARQYEWSTWKSQPNCLKRSTFEDNPEKGLIAVDFRAGLALLPFLPMSPGDILLIFQGLGRGSLVQFDRGSIKKLEAFVRKYPEEFTDMQDMLKELKSDEQIYRDSTPDITHNGLRLLYSGRLWSTMLHSAAVGWGTRNIVDQDHAEKFKKNKFAAFLFMLIGIIPFLGGFLRRFWGNSPFRRHYLNLFSPSYLRRAIGGKMSEKCISWYRAGRVVESTAKKCSRSLLSFMIHLPISLLPLGIHKFLTDVNYFKEKLDFIFRRPVRLYFNSQLREEWFLEMVEEGQKKHIITDEDAEEIRSQIKEPFIQKYLKSLAVHVCTLPITQVVSVIIAGIYLMTHPELPWKQAWGTALGIIAAFQVVPLSPGSLTRGLYVLYLVIKERNYKDYNIALPLGFFKYIGYLSFPIQMTYRYPTIARFMAGHWATEAVHVVPVFGESGALLEHYVFSLFYNKPLTLRRRIGERLESRKTLKPRYWHAGIYAIFCAALFGGADYLYHQFFIEIPSMKDILPLIILLPIFCGTLLTKGGGGASIWKRLFTALICGALSGILYTGATYGISTNLGIPVEANVLLSTAVWRVFALTIFFGIGTMIGELR